MAKVKFPSEVEQKEKLVQGDKLLVFDSEELDPTKTIKSTGDIPLWQNETLSTSSGLLYNWFAAQEDIMPVGFDVPTFADWQTLNTYLGGFTASRLILDVSWDTVPEIADSLNFNVISSGRRMEDGVFTGVGTNSFLMVKDEVNATDQKTCLFTVLNTLALFTLSETTGIAKTRGFAIRGFRAASVGEQLLVDGSFVSSATDADGNIYKCVKIGTQVWMAENLRTTKYNNGTDIANVTDDAAWSALSTAAYSSYDNEPIVSYEFESGNIITPKDPTKKVASHDIVFSLVAFEGNTNWGNLGATFAPTITTKFNKAVITEDVVITLPEYSASQNVSFMFKLTQGGVGGFNITFQDVNSVAAINLSQFVFTDGAAGERIWITLLWDGDEWAFTSSAWQDAVV
jgi:uncharacterized protein (TIGR02145 family)